MDGIAFRRIASWIKKKSTEETEKSPARSGFLFEERAYMKTAYESIHAISDGRGRFIAGSHLHLFLFQKLVIEKEEEVSIEAWVIHMGNSYVFRAKYSDTTLYAVSGPAVRWMMDRGFISPGSRKGSYCVGPKVSTWKAYMGLGRAGDTLQEKEPDA